MTNPRLAPSAPGGIVGGGAGVSRKGQGAQGERQETRERLLWAPGIARKRQWTRWTALGHARDLHKLKISLDKKELTRLVFPFINQLAFDAGKCQGHVCMTDFAKHWSI